MSATAELMAMMEREDPFEYDPSALHDLQMQRRRNDSRQHGHG
jgi:hypothetical protein